MYVVVGANGRAGGQTAHALLNQGNPVRVVLRRPEQAESWRSRGAEAVIADIEDTPRLTAALTGASGAFLLSPPPESGDPYRRAEEIGRALAVAVRKVGVPKIVALSSIGAQHETGTGVIATLNILERHLDGLAPSTTFLRPGYFIETWGEVAATARAGGVLPSFLDLTQKIPMVSTIDVGRTAAHLLCDDFQGRRIVELSGPQDWNANDVARAFGKALVRRVDAHFVPTEDRSAALAREGIPKEVGDALLGMYEGIAKGRVAQENGNELRRGSVSLSDAVERIVRNMSQTVP